MGNGCCKQGETEQVKQSDTPNVKRKKIFKSPDFVESLVREALAVLRTLVDEDQQEPCFRLELALIADEDWLLVVRSLCKGIPLDDPIGPSVIYFILDDSPLPNRKALSGLIDLISNKNADPAFERNFCIALACIAEKLAGPSSVFMLNSATLKFLLSRLDYRKNYDPQVILSALLALEKFAKITENKVVIEKRMSKMPAGHPLLALEEWVDESDLIRRQVGFCAQWALDNFFMIAGREFSYLKTDVTGINVMLNANDASGYLKIAPDGLEARGDVSSFESVRSTFEINSGCWYYEAYPITAGIMQIGWATGDSVFLSHEGSGIGDDNNSIGYDGCRQLIWYKTQSVATTQNYWQPHDVLGCLLDLDKGECIFSLNGECLPASICAPFFENRGSSGFYAAASFTTHQHCRFNFGLSEFVFPPKDRPFKIMNEHAELSPGTAPIVPRHLGRQQVVISSNNVCSICVDLEACIVLYPCLHGGFCERCANIFEDCPLCRGRVRGKRKLERYD